MIELLNYEILKDNGASKMKFWFRNLSDVEIDSQIRFIELPFRSYSKVHHLKLKPGVNHWVMLEMRTAQDKGAGFYAGFNCGTDVEIKVAGNLKFKISLPWTITNLDLRKGLHKNSSIHKNKFWLIGDSHTNYNTHASEDLVTTEKYDIVSVAHSGLSLSRFLNSDWKRFFNTIPIWEEDVIALEFGRVDLGMSIHKRAERKNISVNFLLKEVLQKYSNFINDFKNHYGNELIIIAPNRPTKDGWDELKRPITDSFNRVNLWNEMNSYLSDFAKIYGFKYWDYKEMYTDNDGTIKNEILIEKDFHINIKEPMLTDLKYKIQTFL